MKFPFHPDDLSEGRALEQRSGVDLTSLHLQDVLSSPRLSRSMLRFFEMEASAENLAFLADCLALGAPRGQLPAAIVQPLSQLAGRRHGRDPAAFSDYADPDAAWLYVEYILAETANVASAARKRLRRAFEAPAAEDGGPLAPKLTMAAFAAAVTSIGATVRDAKGRFLTALQRAMDRSGNPELSEALLLQLRTLRQRLAQDLAAGSSGTLLLASPARDGSPLVVAAASEERARSLLEGPDGTLLDRDPTTMVFIFARAAQGDGLEVAFAAGKTRTDSKERGLLQAALDFHPGCAGLKVEDRLWSQLSRPPAGLLELSVVFRRHVQEAHAAIATGELRHLTVWSGLGGQHLPVVGPPTGARGRPRLGALARKLDEEPYLVAAALVQLDPAARELRLRLDRGSSTAEAEVETVLRELQLGGLRLRKVADLSQFRAPQLVESLRGLLAREEAHQQQRLRASPKGTLLLFNHFGWPGGLVAVVGRGARHPVLLEESRSHLTPAILKTGGRLSADYELDVESGVLRLGLSSLKGPFRDLVDAFLPPFVRRLEVAALEDVPEAVQRLLQAERKAQAGLLRAGFTGRFQLVRRAPDGLPLLRLARGRGTLSWADPDVSRALGRVQTLSGVLAARSLGPAGLELALAGDNLGQGQLAAVKVALQAGGLAASVVLADPRVDLAAQVDEEEQRRVLAERKRNRGPLQRLVDKVRSAERRELVRWITKDGKRGYPDLAQAGAVVDARFQSELGHTALDKVALRQLLKLRTGSVGIHLTKLDRSSHKLYAFALVSRVDEEGAAWDELWVHGFATTPGNLPKGTLRNDKWCRVQAVPAQPALTRRRSIQIDDGSDDAVITRQDGL